MRFSALRAVCLFFSIFSSNCLVMILNFVMIGCCNHFGFGNRLVPNPDKIFVISYNRGTILCLWFTNWFPGKFFYCIQIVNIEELFRKTSPWELIFFEERICGPAVACRLNRKRNDLHLKQMQIILDWTLRNLVIYIYIWSLQETANFSRGCEWYDAVVARLQVSLINPLSLMNQLFVLPSNCYTFPGKLVTSFWL